MRTVKKINRLFIEADSMETENNKDMAGTLAHFAAAVAKVDVGQDAMKFFDVVIDDALDRGPEAWKAIMGADEIYMSTAIVPKIGSGGGGYGSPALFNNMMYKAAEAGLENKKVFIYREYGAVRWENLRKELVDRAFKKNFLYVQSADGMSWEQVDVDTLLREVFK